MSQLKGDTPDDEDMSAVKADLERAMIERAEHRDATDGEKIPTPRTDGWVIEVNENEIGCNMVHVDRCEQLERELAHMKRSNDTMFERLAPSVEYVEGTAVGYGEDEIDRLRHDLERAMANHNADISVRSEIVTNDRNAIIEECAIRAENYAAHCGANEAYERQAASSDIADNIRALKAILPPLESEALKLAEQWKGRADDTGRLSRAVIEDTSGSKTLKIWTCCTYRSPFCRDHCAAPHLNCAPMSGECALAETETSRSATEQKNAAPQVRDGASPRQLSGITGEPAGAAPLGDKHDEVIDRLEDFVQEACSARPEDKHHALQDLASLRDARSSVAGYEDVLTKQVAMLQKELGWAWRFCHEEQDRNEKLEARLSATLTSNDVEKIKAYRIAYWEGFDQTKNWLCEKLLEYVDEGKK